MCSVHADSRQLSSIQRVEKAQLKKQSSASCQRCYRGCLHTCVQLPNQLHMFTCDEGCFARELEPLQHCIALVATQHGIISRGTGRPARETRQHTSFKSLCIKLRQLQAAATSCTRPHAGLFDLVQTASTVRNLPMTTKYAKPRPCTLATSQPSPSAHQAHAIPKWHVHYLHPLI